MALSPVLKRRIRIFTRNRRGFWSLILLTILFALSLCAELIANDQPIYIRMGERHFFPAFEFVPETALGGDFETEADWRDPFVQKLIAQKDHTIIWPLLHYDYATIDFQSTEPAPAAPGERHLIGTDDQGRDVLARLIYGFRISMLFGLLLTFFSATIGIVAGAVQGYFGGWVDLIFQRIIEVLTSIPFLVLLITIASMITPGFWTLLCIMVFVMWVYLVDVVRAECLKTRNMDYVRAARALGVGHGAILFRHVLPNAFVSGLTLIPILLNISITSLTALDFLGFGLPPETASLGELLKQGKDNIHAPWLLLSGFFTLAVMMSMLVFIGEAFRDAFDPRKGV